MKFLDIVLLPKAVYAKLNESKVSLIIGVLLVGIIDLINCFYSYYVGETKLPNGKLFEVTTNSILILLGLVIIVGCIDVLFFSIPAFDLFKIFKKEENATHINPPILKLMKIYIIANIMIAPFNLLISYMSKNIDNFMSYGFVIDLIEMIYLIIPIWYAAIITRGINSIYRFQDIYKRFVIVVVFIWSYTLSMGMAFVINKCVPYILNFFL